MKITLSRISGEKVQCLLCPHLCLIADGKTGICGVRRSNGKETELLTYGIISGFASDPMEKKPLYHFFPGSRVLSVGSYGCNLKCDFCQNYHISQDYNRRFASRTGPEELALQAKLIPGNAGIAFTYNEPVIWYEFVRDTAIAVKREGLHTVMVSNGFVSEGPLAGYLDLIDAFNIDLKAFNNSFYRKVAGADLEPVKKTLKMISASGKHLEITNLLIPELNDSNPEMEEMAKWISGELGRETPFHISRYFPMYKRMNEATPVEYLSRFLEIATKYLDFVYIGNSSGSKGQDTFCPGCGKVITRRSGYSITHTGTADGSCLTCGRQVYRHFTFSS